MGKSPKTLPLPVAYADNQIAHVMRHEDADLPPTMSSRQRRREAAKLNKKKGNLQKKKGKK